jgi:UPF0755 protein
MVQIARFICRLVIIGSVGLLTIGGSAWLFNTWLHKPGPLRNQQTIVLPPGLSVQAIANRLLLVGAIERAVLFRVAVRLRPGDKFLKAGEYQIAPGSSPDIIIKKLITGETVIHKITVPEGLTVSQVYALVAETTALSGTINIGVEEGFLLPNTYHYSLDHSKNKMLQQMEDLMRDTLRNQWKKRAPNLPYNRPLDALILASIIEKETSLTNERQRVAAVFVNRLRLGMPLQSDPTVAYGVTKGERRLGRPLKLEELRDSTNPYNTYRHLGLPPGPIANPGKASLAAALSPLATDELYFVADGKGGHNFAKTLGEHNKNVARWKKFRTQTLDCGAC